MRTLIVLATVVSLSATIVTSYSAFHARHQRNIIVRGAGPSGKGAIQPLRARPLPFHLDPKNNPFVTNKQPRPPSEGFTEEQKSTYVVKGVDVFKEQQPEDFTKSGIYSNRETSEIEIYIAPEMEDVWQGLIGRQMISKGTKTPMDEPLDDPPPIVVSMTENTHFVAVSPSRYSERRVSALYSFFSEERERVNGVDVTDKQPIVIVTSKQEILDLNALVEQALFFQKIHNADQMIMIPAEEKASSMHSVSNSKKIKPKDVRMAPVGISRALGWPRAKYTNPQPKVNLRFTQQSPASDKYPSWQDIIFVDGSRNPIPPDMNKRSNTITTIIDQEAESAATDRNSTNNDAATTEFQSYLSAFQTLQGNISDAILPILEEIVNNTNSSLVYNVAWSIWSDLTASTEIVMGPFSHGMHCLDSLEDQYAAANNLSENSPQFQDYLAVHAALLDLYSYAWNASVQAANVTGALTILSGLAQNLRPNDTAIQSASFSNISQASFEDTFFARYDKILI